MRYLAPFLLLLTACGIFNDDYTVYDPYATGIYPIESTPFSEVIITYATELKHDKRLRFEDAKIYWDTSVRRVRVIFSTQHILELCEARELMVDVVEGLLERLNSNGDVVVSFDHAPITADDLELYFSYESFYVEYLDPTYIAWMNLHDGDVHYYSGLIKNPRIDHWNQRTEPYFKSLEFVQIQRRAEKEYRKKHPGKSKEPFIRTIE